MRFRVRGQLLRFPPSGFAGDLSPGGSGVLSPLPGKSFGSADVSHSLYADFDGESDGATPNSSATVGTWSRIDANAVISTTYSKTGGASFGYGPGSSRIIGHTWTPTVGARLSYQVRSALAAAEISGGGWKFNWLLENSDAYQGPNLQYNICWPTKSYAAADGFSIAGNGVSGSANIDMGFGEIVAADEWISILAAMCPDGWRFLSASPTFGLLEIVNGENQYDYFANTVGTVQQLNFGGAPPDGDCWYDMINVHVGADTLGAVLVADTQDFSQCTYFYEAQLDSWDSSAIDLTWRVPGGFDFSGKSIHVLDYAGVHENGGIGRLLA
jgi:hypothetical protein